MCGAMTASILEIPDYCEQLNKGKSLGQGTELNYWSVESVLLMVHRAEHK